jgi:hypothetical protein
LSAGVGEEQKEDCAGEFADECDGSVADRQCMSA